MQRRPHGVNANSWRTRFSRWEFKSVIFLPIISEQTFAILFRQFPSFGANQQRKERVRRRLGLNVGQTNTGLETLKSASSAALSGSRVEFYFIP